MRKRAGKMGVVLAFTIVCAIFMAVWTILGLAQSAKASSLHLVINEIYPAPLSGEKEWVELYNPTDDTIDLSLYLLEDGATATESLSGNVEAGGYFVFEAYSSWLNNSADILFLIELENGNLVDKVAYGDWKTAVLPGNTDTSANDNALYPGSGKSISRIPNGYDSDNDKNDFRIVPTSKDGENLLPVFSNQIIINEIVPEPANESDAEYIELFNISDEAVDLSGWYIDDCEGGASPYLIAPDSQIAGRGFLVFHRAHTNISLNDSGDTARLIDPNGEIKSQITYTPAKKNESFSNFSDGWLWSTTLTPGKENIFTVDIETADEEPAIPEQSIFEAKNQKVGATLSVKGVVTVLPGVLSRQYFYIQDAVSGIQIYSYDGGFPNFSVGDILSVKGELSSYFGEFRIKISFTSDIQVIGFIGPPQAVQMSLEELSEENVGLYAQTAGVVTESSGPTFTISGSSKLKVLIKDGAGINKPRLKRGDKVFVAGIISTSKGALRILPFGASGVMILTSGRLPISGADIWNLSAKIQTIQSDLWSRQPIDSMAEMWWLYMVIWGAARPQV